MSGAAQAWTGFWRAEPAARMGATLADLPRDLNDRLAAPWAVLAKGLPPRAKVLDLATGGGAVLDALHALRGDLRLTGVDSAEGLPRRPGMRLLGRTANERLSFADVTFDAVTSRFGIEYGPLAASAAEAARVLRPGGRIALVLHHAGSRIVSHNRARAAALQWAAHDSGWLEKAHGFAGARRVLALPVPPGFAAAPGEAARRYPDQPVAWEFLTGIAQILHLTHPSQAEAALGELLARAEGELARLRALEEAALDEVRRDTLAAAFEAAGVALDPVAPILEPNGMPLAWLMTGVRAR